MLAAATAAALQPLPASLRLMPEAGAAPRLLDRGGMPLGGPLVSGWNVYDAVPLEQVPEFLQQAFLLSEDQRFYVHGGADWSARSHALWQNLAGLQVVRGASTVSEQVVRILHPRPRTYWSRWVEGFEAAALERRFSKADILEFYLNQVPYASGRRGVVQAAHWYFDRDLETLSRKEMLALAVLVRAPSAYDLYRGTAAVDRPVRELGAKLRDAGLMSLGQYAALGAEPYRLERSGPDADATAFSSYVIRSRPPAHGAYLRTSLDLGVQRAVQTLVDQRLKQLAGSGIHNAAALVVDNRDNSIAAWVVGGAGRERRAGAPGTAIDAVQVPRQPGSTLKPFVYALALEKGWTPATLIDDSRIVEAVGHGLHTFRNYSGEHYGRITLRDALGNSLNIPAVRAVEFVGPAQLLSTLRRLGFGTLDRDADYYGDGLALGDGEVTLFGLVQAYSTLARGGEYLPLTALAEPGPRRAERVYSTEASSLIGNILSDPGARRLEFGTGGLLQFPVQTAVKTGTSSGYHDAWTVGFDSRYTVGVWMGNLDYAPMDGITGSMGPALVTRAVFAELDRRHAPAALYLSPRLVQRDICVHEDVMPKGQCLKRSEWFMPGTAPQKTRAVAARKPELAPRAAGRVHLETPTEGLLLAYDPRIPPASQAFRMSLSEGPQYARVAWWVDGKQVAVTSGAEYLWPVSRGRHHVSAQIWLAGSDRLIGIDEVGFTVK